MGVAEPSQCTYLVANGSRGAGELERAAVLGKALLGACHGEIQVASLVTDPRQQPIESEALSGFLRLGKKRERLIDTIDDAQAAGNGDFHLDHLDGAVPAAARFCQARQGLLEMTDRLAVRRLLHGLRACL